MADLDEVRRLIHESLMLLKQKYVDHSGSYGRSDQFHYWCRLCYARSDRGDKIATVDGVHHKPSCIFHQLAETEKALANELKGE